MKLITQRISSVDDAWKWTIFMALKDFCELCNSHYMEESDVLKLRPLYPLAFSFFWGQRRHSVSGSALQNEAHSQTNGCPEASDLTRSRQQSLRVRSGALGWLREKRTSLRFAKRTQKIITSLLSENIYLFGLRVHCKFESVISSEIQ